MTDNTPNTPEGPETPASGSSEPPAAETHAAGAPWNVAPNSPAHSEAAPAPADPGYPPIPAPPNPTSPDPAQQASIYQPPAPAPGYSAPATPPYSPEQQPYAQQSQQSYGTEQQPYAQQQAIPTEVYGQQQEPQATTGPTPSGPPYGAPTAYGAPAPGQPGGKKSKTPLWIGLGAVVLVIVLVGGLLLLRGLLNRQDDPNPGPSSDAPITYDTPEAAVEAYLTAIADGDAATALALSRTPGNSALLTDEMLAASAALAPMTDIVVTPEQSSDEFTAEIEVSYQLGSETINTSVTAYGDGNGEWTVSGTTLVYVPYGADGLDITLNGIAIEDPDNIELFPGMYEIGTTTTYYTFTGTTQTSVEPEFSSSALENAKPALNEDGVAVFQEAINTAVEACLASTKLDPGCGLAISPEPSNDLQPIEDTVVRTLSAEGQVALGQLEPELDSSNPFAVSAGSIGIVEATLQCTNMTSGATEGCSPFLGRSLSYPVVDFSSDPVTVIW
ncbi:MAG: hypothetical protein ACK5H2_05535 [Beutenbergiaceae bacterium]